MKKKKLLPQKKKPLCTVPKNPEHTQVGRRNQFPYQKKGKRKG